VQENIVQNQVLQRQIVLLVLIILTQMENRLMIVCHVSQDSIVQGQETPLLQEVVLPDIIVDTGHRQIRQVTVCQKDLMIMVHAHKDTSVL
jgi:hypothetical protein